MVKNCQKKFNSNIINLLTIVPQRINLLDASVKDNIVFTQKYKNENELLDKLENLKHICKLDFIDKKTKGWNLRLEKMVQN